MKKLFLSISFIAITAINLQQTHAAQAPTGRFAWQIIKPYAKKGVAGLATAAQCYLAAGDLYKEGFKKTYRSLNPDKALKDYPNAAATQFITEEMHLLSPENDIKNVKTDYALSPHKGIEAVGKNHITIPL